MGSYELVLGRVERSKSFTVCRKKKRGTSMKKIMFALICATCAAFAADMPRSEWHAKVGDCAQDPAMLKQTMSQLSAADQTAFLAEVNDAISKMPGSDEVKAAKFLDANRAAVSGATASNRSAVLAEVFATVPPEYLTVINENFASDLFNRNANPSRPFTDEEYITLTTNTMAVITARCASAENSAVRDAFAALMFERASGGSPEGLRDILVSTLPESSQEAARSEWFPAAMGEGREKTYDPMLGVSEAGEEPNHAAVLQLTGPQVGQALLADLQSEGSGSGSSSASAFVAPGIVGAGGADAAGGITGDQPDSGLNRVPRSAILSSTPNGLRPVKDAAGNVMRDENGNEMFYGPNGEIVHKTTDAAGNPVYVDGNGDIVNNPYNGGKHRGDGTPTTVVNIPEPTPTPTPEPVPYP